MSPDCATVSRSSSVFTYIDREGTSLYSSCKHMVMNDHLWCVHAQDVPDAKALVHDGAPDIAFESCSFGEHCSTCGGLLLCFVTACCPLQSQLQSALTLCSCRCTLRSPHMQKCVLATRLALSRVQSTAGGRPS